MKSLTFPLVLGVLAVISHAAPAPVQPQARQAPTTLAVDFYGAGDTTPEYEVDVFLPTDENFYSFNISESLSSLFGGLLALLYWGLYTCIYRESYYHRTNLCRSQSCKRISHLCWWSWVLRYQWSRGQFDDCKWRLLRRRWTTTGSSVRCLQHLLMDRMGQIGLMSEET